MTEPLVPVPHDVLASDPERERVAEALRGHATAGRLEPDELDERLGLAYAARHRADLLPLLADLPTPVAPRPGPRRRPLPDITPVIALAILLVAIWAVTGAGYFWPVWPIGAVALSTFKHRHRCVRSRSSVRSNLAS
jgi:hypothetical protein